MNDHERTLLERIALRLVHSRRLSTKHKLSAPIGTETRVHIVDLTSWNRAGWSVQRYDGTTVYVEKAR